MGGTDSSIPPRSAGQAQDSTALERRGVGSEGPGFWNSNEFLVWNLEGLQSWEFQGAVVPEFWREFGWVLASRNLSQKLAPSPGAGQSVFSQLTSVRLGVSIHLSQGPERWHQQGPPHAQPGGMFPSARPLL